MQLIGVQINENYNIQIVIGGDVLYGITDVSFYVDFMNDKLQIQVSQ